MNLSDPTGTKRELRRIGRQGALMAGLAHISAFALLVLFSLGSLAALASQPVAQALAAWQAGRIDLPATISVAVTGLLVLCMDIAALYAASTLRVLSARRADPSERRVHVGALVLACTLEGATYAYMSWLYDHPATVIAWALILARAAAAPLFAVYLSLARTHPVGSRDILHGVEMAAGAGVLGDAVAIAADPSAPLAVKASIFQAAAIMRAADSERLARVLDAVGPGRPHPHPTGPGSPLIVDADNEAPALALVPGRKGVRTPRRKRAYVPAGTAERKARDAWAAGARTVSEIKRGAHISQSAAAHWRGVLAAEGQALEDLREYRRAQAAQ